MVEVAQVDQTRAAADGYHTRAPGKRAALAYSES